METIDTFVADFVDVRSPGPCEYRKKPCGNTIRVPSSPTRNISRTHFSYLERLINARLMIRADII